MAADLTGSGEGSEPTAATAPATSAAPRPVPMQPILLAPRANRLRFTLIYVFLGIVVVGAIVALGIFATRSINPAPKWSAWKPTGGGQGAAHQIADHVARQYRLPNGDQLVDVISKAPSITPSTSTLPVHFVAVRGAKGAADQVYPVSSTNSVMYSLCGLGTSCEIASGKPSIERGRLVRREILELALYTFKYVGGIQSVIAFMPATPGKTTKYVVFLRPSDLTAELKQPLATTLEKNVPLPAAIPAREVHTIDDTTGPRYYTFSGVAQAPQGDLVFVLAPIPA
jgi:hypothetical protein